MSVCAQVRQVEALRDGRLDQAEREQLEQHLQSCEDCAREQRALAQLAAAIRSLPEVQLDELSLRRRRATLLARASQGSSASKPRRGLLFAALATMFLLGSVPLWKQLTGKPAELAQPTAGSADVLIHAEPGALYSREGGPQGTLVLLVRGRITLDVRGPLGHLPVTVRTPDGEIVDQGTVFTVEVVEQQTRLVSVARGTVVAKIAGLEPRTVRAGERFAPYPTPPPQPLAPAAAQARRKAHAASARLAPAPELQSPTTPEVEFEQAMSAWHAGRHAESAQRFARFLETRPDDARAEDAAYMRVVALTRGAEPAAAADAARRYLARYPHGLRAREMERLVGPH